MTWFRKNFLNDDDGLSAKDYLMLVFTTPYVVAWAVVLVMALIGRPVSEQAVDILRSLDGVVMTIVGGWFGVQAVSEFANSRRQPQPPVVYEPPTYQPDNQTPTLP